MPPAEPYTKPSAKPYGSTANAALAQRSDRSGASVNVRACSRSRLVMLWCCVGDDLAMVCDDQVVRVVADRDGLGMRSL